MNHMKYLFTIKIPKAYRILGVIVHTEYHKYEFYYNELTRDIEYKNQRRTQDPLLYISPESALTIFKRDDIVNSEKGVESFLLSKIAKDNL